MVSDCAKWNIKWHIDRYASPLAYKDGDKYNESDFEGNLLLNEGINLIWALVIGAGGTVYNEANTRIGVGDSAAAVLASQGGLQGANKTYMPMETDYPVSPPVDQKVEFKSVFGAGDHNYVWAEFTVVNAATDAGTNLNRKVSVQGTKYSGQVWTVMVTITLS